MKKKLLMPNRVRRIQGGFSFIPHKFLTEGFYASLNHDEKILYIFLILASDKSGLSYYGDKSICTYTGLFHDAYVTARKGLIEKDLIAYDGVLYQVLELPYEPPGKKLVADLVQNIGKRF